jgi:hypothetical protein
MTRQEGGVEIEASKAWQFQDGLRQNLPVCHYDHHIGLQASQHFEGSRIAELGRLVNRKAPFDGELLDRRSARLQVASSWLIGLRDDTGNFVFP